ncbi:MAG: FprA family A-type flavoprotein [Thermoplasmata archaeon]
MSEGGRDTGPAREVREISDGVFWVGARDRDRRLFDGLIPLPQGTTYNAYLVRGTGRSALIDTVNPGFERELEARVGRVAPLEGVDFVIMNHAEPDHAGAIPYVLERNRRALLVATKRGAEMARVLYGVPEGRLRVVRDGEAIDLGGRSLRFIEAPMLHWPETMFTYLVENRILFPCDFFGLHTARGLYDDQVPELIPFAKRYFGEIMMPYREMGKKALERLRALDIAMIAPSHGPVHRSPRAIMEAYEAWTAGETREKVVVVYVSMWGSTERMVGAITELLSSEGVEVAVHNLAAADIGEVAKDLVDSRGVVLGTPTVLGGMHPLALYAASLVRALRPPLRYAVVLSSHGWAGGAVRQAADVLGPAGLDILGAVDVRGPPGAGDLKKVEELGAVLAMRVRGG